MSKGNFYLGVGTGEEMNEYPMTGLWLCYNKRQDMMWEAIELIRLLWSGEEEPSTGNIMGRGKPDCTRYFGGVSHLHLTLVPNSSLVAGYYGDSLISVANPPKVVKAIIANFKAGARKAVKNPEKMPKQVEITVAYTDDVDAAVKIFKQY